MAQDLRDNIIKIQDQSLVDLSRLINSLDQSLKKPTDLLTL